MDISCWYYPILFRLWSKDASAVSKYLCMCRIMVVLSCRKAPPFFIIYFWGPIWRSWENKSLRRGVEWWHRPSWYKNICMSRIWMKIGWYDKWSQNWNDRYFYSQLLAAFIVYRLVRPCRDGINSLATSWVTITIMVSTLF